MLLNPSGHSHLLADENIIATAKKQNKKKCAGKSKRRTHRHERRGVWEVFERVTVSRGAREFQHAAEQ
jgi:hypothetical protein